MAGSSSNNRRLTGVPFAEKIIAAGKVLYLFLSKKPVKFTARIGITVLFVYFVNKGIGRDEIARMAGDLSVPYCVVAFLLGIASLLLQVARWQIVLQAHHFPSGISAAARTMFKGFLLAFVTPGRVGELFRAVELDATRKKESVAAVFEERLFGVAAIVATGFAAVIAEVVLLHHRPFFPLLIASLLFIIILTGVVAVVAGNQKIPRFIVTLVPAIEQWFAASNRRIAGYPLLYLIVLSLGSQLLLLIETALLLKMFGAANIVMNVVVAAQAYAFMALLPFFIANIGIREYSFSFFLIRVTGNPLLLPATAAIALGSATVILLFNIMFPAAVGLVWFYTEKKSGLMSGKVAQQK